jgi:predicted  nucleic acid-binding Zn-ribbon protein
MLACFTEVLKARIKQEKQFLMTEHDQDRDAYQKLLADYNSLEQRSESLEAEIARLQRVGTTASGAKKGHQRNLSDASTASATSELPDEVSHVGMLVSAVCRASV